MVNHNFAPYVTYSIVALCFLSHLLIDPMAFAINPVLVGSDEPWRLFTAIFAHSGWFHLVGNMFVLYLLGSWLEYEIGVKRYLTIYLASGLIAAAVTVTGYLPTDYGLGASGAIAGIIGAGLWVSRLKDNEKRVRMYWRMIRDVVIFGVLFNLILSTRYDNVAHIVGFVVGLATAYILVKTAPQYDCRDLTPPFWFVNSNIPSDVRPEKVIAMIDILQSNDWHWSFNTLPDQTTRATLRSPDASAMLTLEMPVSDMQMDDTQDAAWNVLGNMVSNDEVLYLRIGEMYRDYREYPQLSFQQEA